MRRPNLLRLRICCDSRTVRAPMQELISHLQSPADLSSSQVEDAVRRLLSEQISDEEKARFLRALREKGETAEEIAAFAQALLARAVDPRIDAGTLPGPLLDVCGTGGDKMELFNISTASMFILAAGGVVVVKHGNRAITSQCGGADVLEALGVRIDLPPEALKRCVESLGLGFVFAPHYHPAFKAIAPVRKLLATQGIPTIFNMLGPLLNPVRPPYQMVGIFSAALLGKYAHTLGTLGRQRAWALHGDGTDELSNTGPSQVHEVTVNGVREFEIRPGALGLPPATFEELRGGDRQFNARLLSHLLAGTETGAKRDVILLNAAAGFLITGLAPDMESGLTLAREQIDSGRAFSKLQALRDFSA